MHEDREEKRCGDQVLEGYFEPKVSKKGRQRYPRSRGALKNGEKGLKAEQKVLERYT
jgi:hypothetical protein